jgi:hypothetical protein
VGSATTQGRPATRDSAAGHVAFRSGDSVGVLIANFRSSIPSPSVPLFTLQRTPRDVHCKTRGRVDRYSFLVRLFHPLSHAGLSRRTTTFCRVGRGNFTPSPSQVGSRAGAHTLGSGGNSIAFAMDRSPATMVTFPAPATSNAACGFPALRFPVCFVPKVMRPIALGALSEPPNDEPYSR